MHDEDGELGDDSDFDSLLRRIGRAPSIELPHRRPPPLPSPVLDARYELRTPPLGEGAFGIVYAALDRTNNEPIALKVLRHAHPDALLRFKREFRQLAALSDPHFVRLYDLHSDGEQSYFTMELVEGTRFDLWVAQNPEERLHVGFDALLRGVTRLHALGCVHRDIKPSNVMVKADAQVVLLDFGLIHTLRGAEDARATTVAGTPLYVAPEVAAGESPTPASDFYAIGVMLFEALTGQAPFDGSANDIIVQKMTTDPPRVIERAPNADERLARLCDALLERDPSKRWPAHAAPAAPSPPVRQPATSSFVGRDKELADLERAMSRAGIVHVTGVSGAGKSALMGRVVARAKAANRRRILVSRCHSHDHVPFAALDGSVDQLAQLLARLPPARARAIAPRDAGSLVRAFPVLRSIAGFERAGAPEGMTRSRIGTALGELLGRWHHEEGCDDASLPTWTIIIDDAQWGDADSAAIFQELLRDSQVRLCLVLVYRALGGGQVPFVAEIASEQGDAFPQTTIEVGALEAGDARALARMAGVVDDAAADAIVREASGHAFSLLELARNYDAGQPARSLRDVFAAKFTALSPSAARTLKLIVVASASGPIARQSLTHAGARQRDLDELRDARMIELCIVGAARDGDSAKGESVSPSHDRIREDVLAALPSEELPGLHHAVADALLRKEADPSHDAISFHFEAAGDLALAAEHLHLAALAAAKTRAYAQARERYLRLPALRSRARLRDPVIDQKIRLESAEVSARLGRSVEAADALLSAAGHVDDDEEALLLRVRAAEQLLTSGHRARGERILDEQIGRLGLRFPSTTAGRVLGAVRDTLGRRTLDRWYSPATSEARLISLWAAFRAAIAVEPVRAMALGALLAREAARPGATELARIAAAFVDGIAEIGPHGPEALTRARARIDAAWIHRTDPRLTQIHASCLGVIQHFGTEFRESIKSSDESVRIGVEHDLGLSFEETMARATASACAWILGDVERVRETAPALCAEFSERDHLFGWMLVAMHRAWLETLENGSDAGEARIEEARRRWISRGVEMQGWWVDIGRVHLTLIRGDGDEAMRLSRPQARRYRERLFGTLMHRLEAQVFLGRASIVSSLPGGQGRDKSTREKEDILSSCERLAKEIERAPSAWARAHAHCLRAGAASVRGDRDDQAVHALRRAIPALEDAGMILMRVLADDALGCLLGGDEGALLVSSARDTLRAWRVDRHRAMACTLPGRWMEI